LELPEETGLSPSYQSVARTSPSQRVLAKLETKCRLRSELAKLQAELDSLIPQLSHPELVEVRHALAQAAYADDSEIAALRTQVEQEAAQAAKATRAASVVISRVASAALCEEAERRVLNGTYPSTSGLVGEAILKAFGEGRP
jgi:hypothetical protein